MRLPEAERYEQTYCTPYLNVFAMLRYVSVIPRLLTTSERTLNLRTYILQTQFCPRRHPTPTTMRPPLRIAVLECDSPVGRTAEKYGGYGNVFRALLESGAKMLAAEDHGVRPELEISKYDVVNAEHYPDLDEIDACLMTGSSECCDSLDIDCKSSWADAT